MKISACDGLFEPTSASVLTWYPATSGSLLQGTLCAYPNTSGYTLWLDRPSYQDQSWKCHHCSGYNNEHNQIDCPRCGGSRY